MKPMPHYYSVSVEAKPQNPAEISSPGLLSLLSEPPEEFGGPGDLWSPETLLVGAVADCFVLTFKAIASTARLKWTKIHCDGTGTLDHTAEAVRFTKVLLSVRLDIPVDTDPERARRLLEKAETACLVGNSLRFKPVLQCEVVVEEVPQLLPA